MFGERVRELRKQRKMTQGDLGKALGIGQTTIAGWENATKEPKYATLKLVADFFGVTIESLLGKEPEAETGEMLDIQREIDQLRRKVRGGADAKLGGAPLNPAARDALLDGLGITIDAAIKRQGDRNDG